MHESISMKNNKEGIKRQQNVVGQWTYRFCSFKDTYTWRTGNNTQSQTKEKRKENDRWENIENKDYKINSNDTIMKSTAFFHNYITSFKKQVVYHDSMTAIDKWMSAMEHHENHERPLFPHRASQPAHPLSKKLRVVAHLIKNIPPS